MCPRLLSIYGPIAIQSYGLMIVVGLIIFLGITYFHPRRAQLMSGDAYLNAVFLSLLVGVIGGRVLGVIADWESFKLNPIEIFYPWVGGFVVVGAIIAIVAIMPIYLYFKRLPILSSLDFAAVYAPLIQAVARFGCLLAGCCYGAQATQGSWWAITFTNPEAHMPSSLLGVPLLPTQVYAAVLSAGIFIMMLLLQKHFSRIGQALFFYLMSENIARFLVDFWRGDRGHLRSFWGFELSQFQIYSILFFLVGVTIFIIISFFGKKVLDR